MAFDRATQSLSFIEEKLRRAFNLAGPIGAKLDTGAISPVILAHDLRDPGHSSSLGRCFAWACSATAGSPAGISVYTMLFGQDVLIEALYVTGTIGANLTIQAYVTTPSETIPCAAAVADGAWRDRKTTTLDVPPLLTNSAATWAALTGTAIANGNRIACWRGGAAGTSEQTPATREMKVMVPAGGTLTWRSDGASLVVPAVWGRIWP